MDSSRVSVCAEKRGPEGEVEGGMGRMVGNGDMSDSLSRYRRRELDGRHPAY